MYTQPTDSELIDWKWSFLCYIVGAVRYVILVFLFHFHFANAAVAVSFSHPTVVLSVEDNILKPLAGFDKGNRWCVLWSASDHADTD